MTASEEQVAPSQDGKNVSPTSNLATNMTNEGSAPSPDRKDASGADFSSLFGKLTVSSNLKQALNGTFASASKEYQISTNSFLEGEIECLQSEVPRLDAKANKYRSKYKEEATNLRGKNYELELKKISLESAKFSLEMRLMLEKNQVSYLERVITCKEYCVKTWKAASMRSEGDKNVYINLLRRERQENSRLRARLRAAESLHPPAIAHNDHMDIDS